MFIEGIAVADATGTAKELYDVAEGTSGYIPNYLRLFSHRPDAYKAWQQLGAAVRSNLSFRRYELVTVAAARALGGTYCMLAHSDALLSAGEVDEAQLAAIATDFHAAGLSDEEVAIMEFAEKIIRQSSEIMQADVDHLRRFGLTDAEILDITLATTMRSFFSKTLDALNAEPDAKFMHFSEGLRDALSVGRPFGEIVNI
jgi:uncharacterized peroxidase-related enzyme